MNPFTVQSDWSSHPKDLDALTAAVLQALGEAATAAVPEPSLVRSPRIEREVRREASSGPGTTDGGDPPRDPLERAEREVRQVLQSVALEAAANGIMISDRQGRILWVNPAFSRLTGYSPEEIVGKNPRILKSGRHEGSFYREFWERVLSGRIWHGQFINRCKDGSFCVVEQTVTPVRMYNGEITHFISITEDLTEHKRLEEELRQAQKLQAVGQLAAGIAHEFNNLLTVIRCNSELLIESRERLRPNESAALLQHMVAASDRAANLIRQLVAFSQRQDLHCQPLDLSETTETLVRVLRHTTSENIRWQCHFAPGLPRIRADCDKIWQMITNLVSNAVDALPHGGNLSLSTEFRVFHPSAPAHLEQRPGDFVCLSVCDDGCGIASENLPRIFEPFFSTKDVGKGAGLGLSMVYGIVRQHRGWIEVTSQENHGTTVRVFLPAMTTSIDSPGRA